MKEFIMNLLLVISISGCKNEKTLINKNFDVYLEGIPFSDKIEIKAQRLTRIVGDSVLVAKLDLDSVEIAEIFKNINDNNLFSLPDYYKPEPKCDGVPISEMKMVILNGSKKKIFYIYYCDYGIIDSFRVRKIKKSIKYILSIVWSKKVVKDLPISDGIIM